MDSRYDPRLPSTIQKFGQRKILTRIGWRRLALIAGILLALGAGLYFGGKYAYQRYRTYQLDRNLEMAEAAARRENWPKARDLSRSVLLARRDDFAAFRVWQRALAELGEPKAYLAAAQLFVNAKATGEDRLAALGTLARQAPQALALAAYASLEEDVQRSPQARAAVSDVLLLRGELGTAEKMIREIEGNSAHPRIRLALIRVLCALPSQERLDEAREQFAALAASGAPEEALDALVVLGETPGGLDSGEPLPENLPAWVEAQPGATEIHHLLALHPRLEARPEERDAVFKSAVARFSQVAPGTLGTWLVRHDQAALAADELEEAAENGADAYIARLHALLRLKRWQDVERMIEAPPKGVNAVEFELIKVAVSRAQGDHARETAAWNKAIDQAASDTSKNRFIDIAMHAERLGERRVAERAWVAAVRVGWGRLPLYRDFESLFLSLARKDKTQDLLAMYRSLLRYEPQNLELQNNFHYLALLHGMIAPAEILQRFERLTSEHEMPDLYSAACLAALMAGEPAKVFEWLPKLEASRRIPPMMRRALEGTAHALTGNADEAAKILQEVDWRRFLTQEGVVFRSLLMSVEKRNLPLPELPDAENVGVSEESAAWRKAVEQLERDRVREILPPLPVPSQPEPEEDVALDK